MQTLKTLQERAREKFKEIHADMFKGRVSPLYVDEQLKSLITEVWNEAQEDYKTRFNNLDDLDDIAKEWLAYHTEKARNEAIKECEGKWKEKVKKFTKEVDYLTETPRVRRDFCEYCGDVCLKGEVCDCDTEVIRQQLLAIIKDDIENVLLLPKPDITSDKTDV